MMPCWLNLYWLSDCAEFEMPELRPDPAASSALPSSCRHLKKPVKPKILANLAHLE
jgi:hypothetical protein